MPSLPSGWQLTGVELDIFCFNIHNTSELKELLVEVLVVTALNYLRVAFVWVFVALVANPLLCHDQASSVIVNCHRSRRNGAAVPAELLFKVASDSYGKKTPKEMEQMVRPAFR